MSGYVGQNADDIEQYIARVERELAEVAGRELATSAGQYARRLHARNLPILFDADHLAYVCGVEGGTLLAIAAEPHRHYTAFRIRKRGGGSRLIHAPSSELRDVQRWIHRFILTRLERHPASHGFRSGYGIVSNASPHTGRSHLARFDLADFFANTHARRVRNVLASLGYSAALTDLMWRIVTLNGGLPQGAPTSPLLADAAAIQLDRRLSGLANAFDLQYTRYADDLTLSGAAVAQPWLRALVTRIIGEAGYSPNHAKTVVIPESGQQRVTGLVVNGTSPNFPRARRRFLRQEVYYLTRFGVEEHVRRRAYERINYRDWIYGHVCALAMAHPQEARGLLEQLDRVSWPAETSV